MAVADRPSSPNGVAPHNPTITVKNPVTGAIIGEIEKTPREQVEAAVKRARNAQRIWQQMGVRERCRLLMKFADLLWKHQREMMNTIRAETGKNDMDAFGEIVGVDNIIVWLNHHAARILSVERRPAVFPFVQWGKVYHKPVGVVGFITPWNYPLLLVFCDVIPALVAGNSVVIKPSEYTPYTTLYVADLMTQAGIPPEVVQVVTGDGVTGDALIDYVDYIHFTGSTPVGKKIAVRAAERLIPYGLELGGKNPMIVLRDADLDFAAAGMLVGAFENQGQACLCVDRVYVEEPIYDAYLEKVKAYAQKLNIGTGGGLETHLGSLTRDAELERAEHQVADALAKGAKLLYGGKRRPELGPRFYEPAILADTDHSMAVMRDESFGPVVGIMRVKNEAEAVALANDSEFGLSGVIFTRDLQRGEHLATQIDSGDVGVNRALLTSGAPALPWGGQKNSGVGRRNGPEGLLRFTRTQTVLVDTLIGSEPGVGLLTPRVDAVIRAVRILRRFIPFI
jgi:succinate-semialdehyde dehydrogenase / glutarate-semialdehyde dehydrogenase